MLISRYAAAMLSVGMIGLGAGLVSGQEYPNKTIRIVAPAVGGGSDVVARLLAPVLSSNLGQPVIVDNRASALVGAEIGAKAPPDGYTLHINGNLLLISALLQPVPYDVLRDFSQICLISRNVNVLAVHPAVPANSIKELIALAKAKPGQLNYASTGPGGNQHIGGELFKSLAGVNLVRVAYKGGAAAGLALMAGEVQMLVNDAGALMPFAKAGKIRALAVTSTTPSAMAPGLPTMEAAGVPGYDWIGVTGIHAPIKTPAAIIKRLNQEIVRAVNLPETKDRLLAIGEEIIGSSPEEFAARTKSDVVRFAKLVKDAGIKGD